MRRIVLDTETTGLQTSDGHRIIEVGCIEMLDRRISGNQLHFYLLFRDHTNSSPYSPTNLG